MHVFLGREQKGERLDRYLQLLLHVAFPPESAGGPALDGDAVYTVSRATPGLPGTLPGGALVGTLRDEPFVISEGEPECRRVKHPQVVLVGSIDEPLFGGVEFQALALLANQFVLDAACDLSNRGWRPGRFAVSRDAPAVAGPGRSAWQSI